jgi:hypothetical protein
MSFKPMLAATLTDVAAVRFPVLASPKLDGVRAIIQNGVVMSRSMKPIPNAHVQSLYGHIDLEGMDGELIVGSPTAPDCYRVTVSGVMRESGTPNVKFHVFDCVDITAVPFFSRLCHVDNLELLGLRDQGYLVEVDHSPLMTQQELDDYEANCLEQGYEGVMMRDPNGVYVNRDLVKVGKDGTHYLQYSSTQPGQTELVPKLGYTEYLPKWDMVIGTSVNLDGIDAQVAEVQAKVEKRMEGVLLSIIGIAVVVLLVIAAVGMLVANTILRPLHLMKINLDDIAAGEG